MRKSHNQEDFILPISLVITTIILVVILFFIPVRYDTNMKCYINYDSYRKALDRGEKPL